MKIREVCICGKILEEIGFMRFFCLICKTDYSLSRNIVFVKR